MLHKTIVSMALGHSVLQSSEQDFMKLAEAAEDDLLLAQAKGVPSDLTTKQKMAIRRKLSR